MHQKIVRSRQYQKVGEIIVPIFTWLIITLPLWISPFHPALVAYFIIGYNLYFLYKSFSTAYYCVLSYRIIQAAEKIPFFQLLQQKSNADQVQHFVIIPNYKEPIYKLQDTIRAITNSDYPYKTIHLVLAFEKREEEAHDKFLQLKDEFGNYFRDVIATYHVLTEEEVPGKASNQTHASKVVYEYCLDKMFDPKKVLISICDADSIYPKNFFSYLTHKFLQDDDRDYHFYWSAVLLYNNFWQLPFFVRMQATLSSIIRLSTLSRKSKLIQLSTYSTNLWLLKQVNFWDVDIIPEDWHIFLQAFFTFGPRVKTLPLYTITNGDAVYSGNTFKTFVNRYEQEKRWAWGVTDVSYAWNKLFTTQHLPFWPKLRMLLYLAEIHVLWPTSFFLLTISASIPPLINPVFKRTVLGFILPQLSGFILTLATVMLVLYIYLDIQLRKKVNVQTKFINLPLLIVQWYLLPVVSFILSSLPALDAHTRLLIGKKLVYKVTEKV